MNELIGRWPLYLLLLILPLAVAGQNIGTGVIAVLLLTQLYLQRAIFAASRRELWQKFSVPLLASLGYMLVSVAATALNPLNMTMPFASAAGHLTWAALPAVVFLAQKPLDERDWRKLAEVTAIVALILGGMALTQAIWGWHLVGLSFEAGPTRAQGLYSHPLTFAYVCILFFPLGCALARRTPRHWAGWAIAISMVFAIVASRSRTVEVVAGLVVLANLLMIRNRRLSLGLVGSFLVVGALVLATDNPIGERFRGMLVRHDVRSDYPVDDRLAFWHANFEMFLDRPLLGHGENLPESYRSPYYDAIGLHDFERKYPAHNMFLQFAVNGGLLGLACWLLWFGWHLRYSWRRAAGTDPERIGWWTLIAFAAAAITQNAFQDSGVRYAFALVAAALWLCTPKTSALKHPR